MRELEPQMGPDEILEKFKIGNRRFLDGKPRECGAVKAAVDDVKLGNITPMPANLTPAVRAVAEAMGKATSEDKACVAAVAKQNLLLNMEKILKDSSIIAEMVENKEVRIAGCMYDLETGAVEFYD